MKKPEISICIPVYPEMPNGAFFLQRCLDSIKLQSFKDYEIIITREGKMAENTNAGIKKAKGRLIKILYQDDYFAHENALQFIADAFTGMWLVSGCGHDPGTHTHYPKYNHDIWKGVNTIGSPSVLTIRNEEPLLFDESLSWLLDCDLYKRMFDKYGYPKILDDINVMIGVGEHQHTHRMEDELKLYEYNYLKEKYDTTPTTNN